jgi:hypothetical protein
MENLGLIQTVEIGKAIIFNRNGISLNIDHQVGTSEIRIKQEGNYLVGYSISAVQSNQFALFVNSKVIPGSIYGSGAGTQQNIGQVIVKLSEGDIVTLVNYLSTKAIILENLSGGTGVNVGAAITFQKLN